MLKKKIYLETSLFNHYFDVRTQEFHDDTRALFEACAVGIFEPYTSHFVIEELEAAQPEKRNKMTSLIDQYNIKVLATSFEADDLARRYISEGALPGGSLLDASHIATASVNELDMIISLNFRHIVRGKTIELTGKINTSLGYKIVEINSPKEALDYEKNRRSCLG